MVDVCNDAECVKETWKPVAIEPFGSVYECSDLGNVRRIGSSSPLRPAPQSRGYLCVGIYYPNVSPKKQKMFTVHRLVAATWLEGPEKPQVNHKDGNKLNNAASNLEWVTHRENMRHAIETGLIQLGQRRYSKLSEDDARDVIKLAAAGVPDSQIARVLSVSETCVRHVRFGYTWKHLPRPKTERRKSGVKTAADIRRWRGELTRFVNARMQQHPQDGSAVQQPSTSAAPPGSAA